MNETTGEVIKTKRYVLEPDDDYWISQDIFHGEIVFEREESFRAGATVLIE